MKPSQTASRLRQIATAVNDSKSPRRDLVVADLKRVLSSIRVSARLVLMKNEEHPEGGAAGQYAYFEGVPSGDEVAKVQQALPEYDPANPQMTDQPQQIDDEVSRRAGLSRWYIGPVV